MKTLVVALGGNALLQRGEALTAKNQYRNIASAVPALARLARSYRLAIVHGNGPQVGLLALQNLAWKEVEPYPLDVLVAESQGMIGYMLAQGLSAQPQMPPVTTVLTRIEVSPDDPAFLQPEKFIGPVYQPEEQEALEAAYGWQMKRDGKYLRRVVASPQPRKILDSEAIELLLKEGHVVICSGGGGVPVTEDGAGSEAVIDKDLAAALLAEQINADGLVILTDADAVYENWGTPQQRAIRHATPDELAPFAKADGSMGPKVTAVSGYGTWPHRGIGRDAGGRKGDLYFAVVMGQLATMRCWRVLSGLQAVSKRRHHAASGNRHTMPDAMLARIDGRPDKAFTPHPAIGITMLGCDAGASYQVYRRC